MTKIGKRKAVEAVLSEYRNVVVALQKVIQDISYANLTTIVDSKTADLNCQSIQTILTHVVSSGYSYAGYIRKLKNIPDNRPGRMIKMSSGEYHKDLDALINYTEETFQNIYDNELEELNEEKKIKTSWGQVYDIEQIMEHAVMHVLRHRRQIEKFLRKLETL
jgi:uncharacterized damage-inducible protein DinB